MRRSPVRVALLVSSIGASAAAHIALDQPPPRDAAMKTPPCGGTNPRSATPAVFAPGQKITVKWHETVVHPGFFRVAFSTDGKTFPADPTDPPPAVAPPVLAIIPKVSGTTAYSADITLPDMPCETCTIQVIQYMEQHAPPPYYYQCADIVIRQGAGGSGSGGAANATGGSSAAGSTGSGGSSGTMNVAGTSAAGGTTNVAGAAGSSASADAGSEGAHDSGSGCSVSPRSRGATSWAPWLAVLGAGCMLRRRTSRLRRCVAGRQPTIVARTSHTTA